MKWYWGPWNNLRVKAVLLWLLAMRSYSKNINNRDFRYNTQWELQFAELLVEVSMLHVSICNYEISNSISAYWISCCIQYQKTLSFTCFRVEELSSNISRELFASTEFLWSPLPFKRTFWYSINWWSLFFCPHFLLQTTPRSECHATIPSPTAHIQIVKGATVHKWPGLGCQCVVDSFHPNRYHRDCELQKEHNMIQTKDTENIWQQGEYMCQWQLTPQQERRDNRRIIFRHAWITTARHQSDTTEKIGVQRYFQTEFPVVWIERVPEVQCDSHIFGKTLANMDTWHG